MAIVGKYVIVFNCRFVLYFLCDFSAFNLVFVSVVVGVRNENCAVGLKCCVKSSVPIRDHVDVTNAAGR